MEEQATTPEAPAVESSGESIEDRIAKKFGLADDPPEQPEAEAQPGAAEETQEPQDPEQLSADEVQSEESDAFELIHDGKPVRMSKDEAKKLAQQGYDYTKKTQALAEERRTLEAEKQAVKARTELTPKLVEAAGKFQAIKQQLDAYQSVDWALLAQQDPQNYPAHHATYTKLTQQAQAAYAELSGMWNGAQAADKQISEAEHSQAWNRMLELIPAWRDEKKRAAEMPSVSKYLQTEGYSPDELLKMSDPRFVALARKAKLYDDAVSARSEKSGQLKQAPAVKSGAPVPRISADVKKAEVIKQLHQAKDPQRRKALFDQALDLKFGLSR